LPSGPSFAPSSVDADASVSLAPGSRGGDAKGGDDENGERGRASRSRTRKSRRTRGAPAGGSRRVSLGSSSRLDGDASSPSRPSRSPTDGPAHIPRAHGAFHARDAIRAVRNISATRSIVRDARPASLPAPPLLLSIATIARAHSSLAATLRGRERDLIFFGGTRRVFSPGRSRLYTHKSKFHRKRQDINLTSAQ